MLLQFEQLHDKWVFLQKLFELHVMYYPFIFFINLIEKELKHQRIIGITRNPIL